MPKINIGGQAVIEGVMMRAPRYIAIAVRRPSGEIVVKGDEVVPLSERYPVVKLPVVRGAVALFQSLIVGVKALNFSANEAMVEEGEKKEELSSWAMAGTMAVAFGFGILLFFVLPLYATKLLGAPDAAWRCVGIDPEGVELQHGQTALRLFFPQRVTAPGPLRAVLKQLADEARKV